MSGLIVPMVVSLVVAVLWHGVSLKVACALAGEDSPGMMRTAFVSWIGGLVSGGVSMTFAYTVGIVVSLFISSWVSWGIAAILGLFTAAAIYKRGLKLSGPASLGVAGIHAALTLMFNLVLGGLFYNVAGF